MIKNLLIVESPAKAKTIEKYLGEGFTVQASYGHIRDLPKGGMAVDIENDFQPQYVVSDDKTEVVKRLKKMAKDSQEVWLATDEDREGEAISWHLLQVLELNPNTTKRIVFHEITKSAIQKAIQNPRLVNQDLVDAQQCRRVLDRLVGFEISPILWKKVKFGLSAGRVQSVAVRLIVEREREIKAFQTESFFKIKADFQTQAKEKFKAELNSRFEGEKANEDALFYLTHCINASFQVANVVKKPATRKPSAPFTTSTLQQEASRKLSMSVARTMRIAQTLYENGHITYMRTDSVNLSDTALVGAKQTIESKFGAKYHQLRKYTGKVANAQEAHEAIRPTNFDVMVVSNDSAEQRLYELIWKRTLASQMADAELERTVVDIDVLSPTAPQPLPKLTATGEVIKFDGFLKLYIETKDEDEENDNAESGLLPAMQVGQTVNLLQMQAVEGFTRPAPRYTEASLVKKLEELGIGRPSTYAPTISTIQDRNYVVKEDRDGVIRFYRILTLKDNKLQTTEGKENHGAEKAKLFPTDLGMLVTDFLVEYFQNIVDYHFTAKVEEEFDSIANGELRWQQMLHRFYPPFHRQVLETEQKAERVFGERILGIDPVSQKTVLTRLGRYGPLVQIGDADDPDKRFASLRQGQRMDTITLEEGLALFKLPRVAGTFEGKEMKIGIGKFGPYILHDSKFISIPKTADPYIISESECIELIEQKRVADEAKVLKTFAGSDFRIMKGRWGPYLSANGNQVRLPKDLELTDITLELCEQLAAEHEEKNKETKKSKGTKSTKRASGAKKSTASGNKSEETEENVEVKPVKSTSRPKNKGVNNVKKNS